MLPIQVNQPVLRCNQCGERIKVILSFIKQGTTLTLPALIFVAFAYEFSDLTWRDLPQTFCAEDNRIVTTTGTYEIGVRLEQNKSYIRETEKLYHVFQKNSIPWRTVNNPYAHKYFDVILINCEGISGSEEEEEEVLEIRVNLEDYENYKMADMIPLWNIEKLAVKCPSFPVPAQDRINYENVLSLKKLGIEHGYLVDGDEGILKYLKRTPEELIMISTEEKSGLWDLMRIIKPEKIELGRLEYGLMSNSRKPGFIHKFAQKQSSTVRTESEIVRIIHSFEVSKHLELEQIEIKEPVVEIGETYNLNPFLNDHVRVERDKNSEVQMYFPDFRCAGKLT